MIVTDEAFFTSVTTVTKFKILVAIPAVSSHERSDVIPNRREAAVRNLLFLRATTDPSG
jgi:hypothetical protein